MSASLVLVVGAITLREASFPGYFAAGIVFLWDLSDALTACKELDALLSLAQHAPLALQINDELLALTSLDAFRVLVKGEPLFPGDDNMVAGDLEATAVGHGGV